MGLLEMSISAGVLILLLTLIRGGKLLSISKRTIMLLWLVVLARLLLPGSLPLRGGIAVPALGLLQRVCSMHIGISKETGEHAVSTAPKAASLGAAEHMWISLMQAALLLWLAGLAVMCIYFVYSYRKEYRLLSQALPLKSVRLPAGIQVSEAYQTALRLSGMHIRKKRVRILVHDRIQSPLVFGTLRQNIVIPKSLLFLGQSQMQCILTHELIHIRRHDNVWKLLCAAAVCVHWFNPTVWLMYVLFARDLELSCDEHVLSVYGRCGRQEYAQTLLALAKNQKGTALFCSGFLENPVKERIVAIMKYKKLTGIGVLCAVMLLAGASSVFATNEQETQTEDANMEVNRVDLQSKDTEEKFADYLITEKEDKADKKSANDSLTVSEDGADGKFVQYSILKNEDGKEIVEKSGKGKIKKTGEEEILVEVGDTESLPDGEDIRMTFHGDSDIEVDVSELESGETYKYNSDKKKFVKVEEYAQESFNVSSGTDRIVVDEQRSFEMPEDAETRNAK